MTITEENLTNCRFGKLKVLSRNKYRASDGRFRYQARCQCDCGTIKNISVGALKAGRTKSCGCDKSRYSKIRGENNVQWTGHGKISGHVWSTFKRRSNKREHKFNLQIEDAWDLYLKQNGLCALTKLPIGFGKWNERPTASLDRIDNSKGYELGNVQWVHKDVNIMRNVYSVDYFIKICELVADNFLNSKDS